jgi:DNA-binding IclR family transcriptional regulator
VLLAFHQDAELVERLTSHQLPRWTPTTVTDPASIRTELQEVKSKGYATCWEEREVGLCSVAVPIRDYTNQVIAALTLAGPRDRLNPETVSPHLRLLTMAGSRIQKELGARPE